MTIEEIIKWNELNPIQQAKLFKKARKNLGLTQNQLGDRLKIFGYNGGRSTVQNWEHGSKIPVLVYELILSNFSPRLDLDESFSLDTEIKVNISSIKDFKDW